MEWFLGGMAVLSMFGIIGEKESAVKQWCMTACFAVCVAALVYVKTRTA